MNLVHSHSYTKLYDNQKKKVWDQKVGNSVSDRVGKRVGVLGYGSIGRQGMSTRVLLGFALLDLRSITRGRLKTDVSGIVWISGCLANAHQLLT
jgi:phosphoglycerate dehydrogenase-like enzyme